MNPIIFIDTETTGVDYEKHEIVEIAALKCNPINIFPYARFQTMVNPENGLDPAAQKINGITEGMVKYAASIKYALNDFFNFIGSDSTLVGHCIKTFDLLFINRLAKDIGLKKIDNEIIDTIDIARELGFKRGERSLKKIAEHYEMNFEPGGLHRAAADIELNRRVYIQLMKDKQLKLF